MRRVFFWPETRLLQPLRAGATGSRTVTSRPDALSGSTSASVCRTIIRQALLTWAFVLLCWPVLHAQSSVRIRGQVFDALSGRPIAGATVRLEDTGFETTTDADGRYRLSSVPIGVYSLVGEAAGYDATTRSPVRVLTDVTQQVDILLSPLPREIPGVTVRAAAPQDRERGLTVIDRSELERTRPTDVADALTLVPGLTVRRSGTGTGSVRLSIRGSESRHVLVMVDGHPINGSGDGEADLSAIPLSAVQRIEVCKDGAPPDAAASAAGGVVNVVTQIVGDSRPPKLALQHGSGAFGARASQVDLDELLPLDSLLTRFCVAQEKSRGDFPYSYQPAKSYREYSGPARLNNDYRQTSWFGALTYRPTARRTLAFSGQLFDSERGLPGRASLPVLEARAADDRVLLNTRWQERVSERLEFETRAGWSRLVQRFTDPGDSATYRTAYDSEFRNDVVSASTAARWLPWIGQTAKIGGRVQAEWLRHQDYQASPSEIEESDRTGLSVYTSLSQEVSLPTVSVVDRVTVDASLRYDHVQSSSDPTSPADTAARQAMDNWSPRVGVSVVRGTTTQAVLRASYGKSLTLPSLNALFWKGEARATGNPRLAPERAEHSEAGVEFNTRFRGLSMRGSITYFHTAYRDLVQWQPNFQGIWQPSNLGAARVTGHEDEFAVGLWRDRLELLYTNTSTAALNRVPGLNSYGKRLMHSPRYQTALTTRLSHRLVQAAYTVRWVGRRYANASNTRWYESYRVDDFRAGLRIPWHAWEVSLDYHADNLRNVNYTLITHYPMPPREWRLAAGITYTFE